MGHWIIAPLLIPAVLAAACVLLRQRRLRLARGAAAAGALSLLALALVFVVRADSGVIETYALGGWQAPFGIVLVLDRLSAMMLLTTSLLALAVLAYAIASGLDRAGWHFHPLFQFQLFGLNGAFLTGDIFNLFVFFEVLLIASYGLMLHSAGGARLRAGVHYVVINLVGSTVFLIAAGLLYGATGTLNMADMGARVAAAPPGDRGLILAGGLLLAAVFAMKAAAVPLHFWLPKTYASAVPAVAALFAIMTKVGAYGLLRFTTLVFGQEAGDLAWAPGRWLLPAALATIVVGFVGVLAARRLRQMAAYAVAASMGTLLSAVAVFTPQATAAALYYIPHSTLAAAALFLLADAIAVRRGDHGDNITASAPFAQSGLLGAMFMLTALAVVGLPPLSGFVGKLMILDAVRHAPGGWWIWGVLLPATVLGMLAFALVGGTIFWKSAELAGKPPVGEPRPMTQPVVVGVLLALLAALTLGGGPIFAYLERAADQLYAPQDYRRAILGPGEEAAP